MITITRKFNFCASHVYNNPAWSKEKNKEVFGKCANPHGHGHNYILEVSLKGEVNPETGFLMNLHKLTKIVREHVIEVVDHKNLNKDVPYFADKNPTLEYIAQFFWKTLLPVLPSLEKIQLWETPELYVEYTK